MKYSKEFKTTSFLDSSIELTGKLHVKGGIRIDGKVKGIIKSESTIYAGDTARIQAEVSTVSLVASGKINGKIFAEDTVKIIDSGEITGDIHTCNLGIDKNVYFNGKCQILNPKNNILPDVKPVQTPKTPISNRD